MAASSDNLAASIDPFLLRHSFSDHFWPTPAENDILTKSLYGNDEGFNLLLLQQQQQQPDHHQYQNQNQSFSPFSSSDLEQHNHKSTTHPTPSASDHETSTTPKRRTTAVNGKARITKRKSRATKKNQTTFITADPANFRQMVQQVTGIRFDTNSFSSSSSLLPTPLSDLLKPETRRAVGRLYNACLPTLDTSSYLLDHQQSQNLMNDRNIYNAAGGLTSSQSAIGEGSYGGASDGFASFPTLESWKVM